MSTPTTEREPKIGREGLKMPVVDDAWGARDAGFEFLSFFRKIWELSQTSGNDLVLPATATEPLTVIRRDINHRDRKDVEYDLRRNREQEEWGTWLPATAGYERHGVYVPPQTLGGFVPLVEVDYRLTEGGSGGGISSPVTVYRLGAAIYERDFTPEDPMSMPVEEQLRIEREGYSGEIHTLLSGTVEFLS